jgi:hypothetical protein
MLAFSPVVYNELEVPARVQSFLLRHRKA